MKKTFLYYGLPFALLLITSLLIPGIQYNYFQGSMFNAGTLLGLVHIVSVSAFAVACIAPLAAYLYKQWR